MSEDELTGTRCPRGIGFPEDLDYGPGDVPAGPLYVIRGIEVEVHQKKDHPHEHGHYDALVRLTADVMPGPDPWPVIEDLLELAQQQVQAQIGRWLEGVHEAHRGDIAPVVYPTTDDDTKSTRGDPTAPGRMPRAMREYIDAAKGRGEAPAPSGEGQGPLPRGAMPPGIRGRLMTDEECKEIFGTPTEYAQEE